MASHCCVCVQREQNLNLGGRAMPRIDLYRKPQLIDDRLVKLITPLLREEVAKLLHDGTLEGEVTPGNIRVLVQDAHPLDDNGCDLALNINAKWTAGRRDQHQQIVIDLAELLRKIVPPLVDSPARPIVAWIGLELNHIQGSRIWRKEDFPAS